MSESARALKKEEIEKLYSKAKNYAQELIAAKTIEEYQRSWLEAVYMQVVRETLKDQLQPEKKVEQEKEQSDDISYEMALRYVQNENFNHSQIACFQAGWNQSKLYKDQQSDAVEFVDFLRITRWEFTGGTTLKLRGKSNGRGVKRNPSIYKTIQELYNSEEYKLFKETK